jgi:phosphate transport system substrate-binding protein
VPEGEDLICPKCGSALTEYGANLRRGTETRRSGDAKKEAREPGAKTHSKALMIAILAAVAVIIGIGGYLAWLKLHGPKAAGEGSPKNTILRLAGSNTIGDSLAPSLAEAFLKNQGATEVRTLAGTNPQEKIVQGVLPGDSSPSFITISAHGSATAFTALGDGKCDIGMASRKIKPEEAGKLSALGDMTSAASEHVVGLDGIAVIVNAYNPINQLDKDRIMRIFSGEITDWSQVGSPRGAIEVYARDDNSGTFDTFKSLVLGAKPLTPKALRIEDSKELSDAVAGDPNAIGFIGLPYILSAKPIAVSEKGMLSLLPTRLSVATEDYLLSRRLYFYTPAISQNKFARQFVEFSLSRRGQDVVGASGFVAQNVALVTQAVPENAPGEYKALTQNANRLTLDFRFETGQTVLDNKAKVDLDRVVSLIADLKITGDRVMLFGFSDPVGNPDTNRALSLARAKAIADEFSLRGLNPAIVRGYGSDLGVASNDSQEGQQKNRRVEIWIKN